MENMQKRMRKDPGMCALCKKIWGIYGPFVIEVPICHITTVESS